ncbi:FecR family protein [Chitinophaga parva]|nr:FecR family protein [Chitinophaga parva]
MESSTLAALIRRYINDELTETELSALLETLRTDEHREQWDTAMAALLQDTTAHGHTDPATLEKVWERLQPPPPAIHRPRSLHTIRKWVAAAALLAGVAAGTYYFTQQYTPPVKPASKPATSTSLAVKPGTNKAVLTLADGTQVPLDSTGSGALALQGNSRITQQRNGQLTYTANGNASTTLQYNNLHVPRGGQFRITLSDGTKVWLNAASDLHYPTSFGPGDRRVELSGEAYFEVAQQANHPFKVVVNSSEVQVLGTSFNVSAYGDEAFTRTTLLEGAVKVKSLQGEARLRPGQQAQIHTGGQITVKDDVDMDEVVAWKNGYFQFNHEKISGVMNQLSRWYDLDVTYQGTIPDREFGGHISRSSSIEDIIRILELSKIHVKVDNKKITVMP